MSSFLNFAVAGVLIGGLYGILALPLTLVWRTTGVFDFAVGGYVVAAGIVAADVGWPLGALAGIGVAVALALVTIAFFLLFKVTQGEGEGLGMGLATFGLVLAITAGILTWLGTEPRSLSLIDGSWRLGDIVLTKSRVIAFAAALVLLAAVSAVLARTSLGLRMRSSAVAGEHAELLGVPVRRVQCGAFLVSGVLCGIVGVMAAATVGLSYNSTVQFSILSLSAAVLLGLRGPGTAFAGGIALGVFESLSQGYVGQAAAGVLPSLLILIVLASGIATRGTAMAVRP